MVVFLFLLGIAIMGGVIFMAISRKSGLKVRIAALGALALMIVSVIICLVVYFKEMATPKQLILPDMMPSEMPPPSNTNSVTMIMLIVFLIALFAIIFILAMREQKRTEGKEQPPANNW
jgi:formate-dependent nitrite reductase membrane component NrfD